MVLSEILKETELIYQNRLEDYFSQIFNDVALPSHDLSHHRRVWNFAKELLQSLNTIGIKIGYDIPEKLIIGCYLHDSGMAIDRGIGHGYQSMLYCRIFLENNNLSISHFKDLLSVVENHDGKEYNMTENPGQLFTVLSVSDDLDAFGLTGIYRYSEIYLDRGKNLKELGSLVLENVSKRYRHFVKFFNYDHHLIEKHEIRYNQIESFFSKYSRLSGEYMFDGNLISGHCGVVEIIKRNIVNKKYSIKDIIRDGLRSEDAFIKGFYERLAEESRY
jgi:hypothetical protein